jgi:hypothetical protein
VVGGDSPHRLYKEGHYTVSSSRGVLPEAEKVLTDGRYLKPCFKGCSAHYRRKGQRGEDYNSWRRRW